MIPHRRPRPVEIIEQQQALALGFVRVDHEGVLPRLNSFLIIGQVFALRRFLPVLHAGANGNVPQGGQSLRDRLDGLPPSRLR